LRREMLRIQSDNELTQQEKTKLLQMVWYDDGWWWTDGVLLLFCLHSIYETITRC
jgi:hypothetical protein